MQDSEGAPFRADWFDGAVNQLLVAGVGAVVIASGAFGAGWKVNNWRHAAQELSIQKAGEAAAEAAVAEIRKIKVQNTTIRQELEREIRYAPASAECDISGGVFDQLNKALTPPADRATGVPGPDAAG